MFLFWILKALALSLIYAKTQTPTYSVKKYSSRISAIFFSVYYLKLLLIFAKLCRITDFFKKDCNKCQIIFDAPSVYDWGNFQQS